MSAFVGSYREEMDACYAADFGRDREPMQSRARRPEYRRHGATPARVNGLHRRRQKRWTWGSGRGARLHDSRAFATAVLAAVAGLCFGATASAAPISIQYSNVLQPNFTNSGTTPYGAVTTPYKIGTYEVTNAQYAAFLNTVDASGTNPFGVYNTLMGSTNASAGISFVSGNASGSKYVVKSGFNSKPVTYVNWFSAARFVNWMENGYTSNASLLNSGAYTLTTSATGSSVVARNPGAQNFLPTASEWMKSAFYNPNTSNWTTYATTSNIAPTPTITTSTSSSPNVTQANTANFGRVSPAITNSTTVVGQYVNTVSGFGLYDTYGNVAEMTETGGSTAGTYVLGGSSWKVSVGQIGDWTNNTVFLQGINTSTDALGFRVAAAVPEPGTIALAATGMIGMFGAGWMKRRKQQAQLLAATKAIAA